MFTRSELMRLCAATGVTAALLIGTASAAFAQQAPVTIRGQAPEPAYSVRVNYSDLNLASLDGRKMLGKRVFAASHRVCSPDVWNELLATEEYFNCVSSAQQGAKPQMARAIARAEQYAATGTSAIPAVAIAVSAGF